MAANKNTTYDPLAKKGFENFIQEIQEDKELCSLNIDFIANFNRVLPDYYDQTLYLFGETFGKILDTNTFKKLINIGAKYAVSLSKIFSWQLILTPTDFENAKFLVCDHANTFYHGTSLENYEKIVKSGHLKLSDYHDIADKEWADNTLREFLSFEKGHVFLSDDFALSAMYAIKRSIKV